MMTGMSCQGNWAAEFGVYGSIQGRESGMGKTGKRHLGDRFLRNLDGEGTGNVRIVAGRKTGIAGIAEMSEGTRKQRFGRRILAEFGT